MEAETEIRATATRVIKALSHDPDASAALMLDAMVHALHALMLTLAEDRPELVTPGLEAIRAVADSVEADRRRALN
jgi:hypothetical protein